ncbi:MAG: ion transporter [Bacteroidales bacterium]|nr:ion transporter [Bacteroidales bacterium]
MKLLKALFLNDKVIITLIILNSIIIFLQGFDFSIKTLYFLDCIDSFITFLFLIEFSVKISHFGFRNYFSSKWNTLDFILIILALPSLLSILMPLNIIRLDYLLALRAVRIFKFLRFIKFVPEIHKIFNGVFRAAKTSVFIILSFFILNLIISIISCSIFKEVCPEYFGNPLKSFYTIFKIFTIEGWHVIPDSISETMNSTFYIIAIKVYFIAILFFCGILGLSLVNAIFVDSMTSDNNDDLEKKVDDLNKKIDKLTETINNTKKNDLSSN